MPAPAYRRLRAVRAADRRRPTGRARCGSAARAPHPAAGPMSADDVTRTLSSLADLRDRGAISAEEYEAKKADLLSRL
jgi:hypothetical protein